MSDHLFPAATGSMPSRAAATRHMQAAKRRSRLPLLLVVVVLTGGLAIVWTVVAKWQLESSIAVEANDHVDSASKAFAIAITRRQAELQAHCRVLVEDPRLKSTLATEGIDEVTVADILADLAKLRGAGFLMVLSPEGRVFAQSGAAELRGLDLSDSSVVKQARNSPSSLAGSWVIAGRVIDLGVMAIRYGDHIIGFLVAGQAIDAQILQVVAEQTGVHAANALAGKVLVSSSSDPQVQAVLAQIAGDAGASRGRATVDGTMFVTGVVQLGETAQSHRLVLARPVDGAMSSFAPFAWLLLAPPLLVLVAVLFSMAVFRRTS